MEARANFIRAGGSTKLQPMPPRPAAPLDRWPLQLHVPEFGFFWFGQPAVFVDQTTHANATERDATLVHDVIDQLLVDRSEEVEAAGGLFIVHDWRSLETYEGDARRTFMARMRQRKPGYLRGAVAVLPKAASPLLRMALEGANLFAAVALSRRIQVAHDITQVLNAHGVTPPPIGQPLLLRALNRQ